MLRVSLRFLMAVIRRTKLSTSDTRAMSENNHALGLGLEVGAAGIVAATDQYVADSFQAATALIQLVHGRGWAGFLAMLMESSQ
jgi:hypothetical protein